MAAPHNVSLPLELLRDETPIRARYVVRDGWLNVIVSTDWMDKRDRRLSTIGDALELMVREANKRTPKKRRPKVAPAAPTL